MSDIQAMAQFFAIKHGRAFPKRSKGHIYFAPHARLLTLAKLSSNDSSIMGFVFGAPMDPTFTTIIHHIDDSRFFDQQIEIFAQLSEVIEAYLKQCEQARQAPQIWIESAQDRYILSRMAHRFITSNHYKGAHSLSYLIQRAEHEGQQVLPCLVDELNSHWATGQAERHNQNPKTWPFWLSNTNEPLALAELHEAQLGHYGPNWDPVLESETLMSLLKQRLAKISSAEQEQYRIKIMVLVHQKLRCRHQNSLSLFELFRSRSAPVLPSLPEWWQLECQQFLSFQSNRMRLLPSATDTALHAAHKLSDREFLDQCITRQRWEEDMALTSEAYLSGKALVINIEFCDGQTFEGYSNQDKIRFRIGDEIQWQKDSGLTVQITDIQALDKGYHISAKSVWGRLSLPLKRKCIFFSSQPGLSFLQRSREQRVRCFKRQAS